MTADRHLDHLVADALRSAAPVAPPDSLVRDILRDARRTRRRPRWLAFFTERPMVRPPVLVGSPTRRAASIALAVILAAVMGTLALVAGGWLPRRDAIVLLPNATPSPSPELTQGPAPTPTVAEAPSGLVVYPVWRRMAVGEGACTVGASWEACTDFSQWISKTDGTEAHRFVIDGSGLWVPVDWSPDGGELLGHDLDSGRLGLIDEFGHLQRTYDVGPCPIEGFCTQDPGLSSWSPDATRLAFAWEVEDFTKSKTTSGLSLLDLRTGIVKEVAGTRSVNRGGQCWKSTKCQGVAESPQWSPDGAQLVFSRRSMSSEPGSPWTSAAIYIVGVDGSDLRRVTPKGLYATNASWSPDGSTIAFDNVKLVYDKENESLAEAGRDIYTIGADGTDLRRLTDDGASSGPRWTADGRLIFGRKEPLVGVETPDGRTALGDTNWIMDADGGAQSELGFDLGTLTAAGCVSCLYPGPAVSTSTQQAFWQPVP